MSGAAAAMAATIAGIAAGANAAMCPAFAAIALIPEGFANCAAVNMRKRGTLLFFREPCGGDNLCFIKPSMATAKSSTSSLALLDCAGGDGALYQ